MQTEITTELLKAIYDRAEQVYLAETGNSAESVEIDEDGGIRCLSSYYCYGETVTESEIISASELTQDLDDIIKARKLKEAIEREEREELQRQRETALKKEQKEQRRAQYNLLKKEFEPNL